MDVMPPTTPVAPLLPGAALAMPPLRIGSISVSPPVVLAPMAGVTNGPFRAICRTYGAGLYVSEMVSARGLVEGSDRSRTLTRFGPDESPRSIQLYGTDPHTIGEAVRLLVDGEGAEHIDLNFGCPVRKVTRHGGGAALPARPRLLRSVVAVAVRAAGDVPITMKVRTGIDERRRTFLDAGRIAEDEGCAAIALHARTAAQLYSGCAAWADIAELKANVTTIPVLGNGDIWTAADALAMLGRTGCDGVVIGRGCLGRPWLFSDLSAALHGRPAPPPPRLDVVTRTMRHHAARLVEWSDELRGIRDFRKHSGWYLHGYAVGTEVRRRLNRVSSSTELDSLLDTLDPDLELPVEHIGSPRGPQHGPKAVTLPEGFLDQSDDLSPLAPEADALVSGG
jgi:nifR3 family TIM-barrel protein